MTLPNEQEQTMTDEKHENLDETNDLPVDGTEPNEAPEEPGDDNDGTEDGSSELAKVRREAAGHRKRLREAEAERDAVTEQRDALAAAVLSEALRGTRLTPELFAAEGRAVEEFLGEDGLDADALSAAVRDAAKKYGVWGSRSPHTGTGAERPPKGKNWSDVLAK